MVRSGSAPEPASTTEEFVILLGQALCLPRSGDHKGRPYVEEGGVFGTISH